MSFLDNDFPHTTFYDSDLTELLEMYKKLIDDYKTLIISISELEKKYETIDEKIAESITPYVEEMQNYVTTEINKLKLDNANEFKKIENNFADLSRKIEEIITEINTLRTYVDELNQKTIDELNVEIERITDNVWLELYKINKRIDEIIKTFPPVENPIDKTIENIQVVLFEMYDALRVLAFTALKFDTSGITAKIFDNSKISALEFDTESEKIFTDLLSFKMFSSVNGKDVSLNDAIDLVDRNNSIFAYKAEWFDAKNLTAQELDMLYLNAYELGYYGEDKLHHNHELLYIGNGFYILIGEEETVSTNWTIKTKNEKNLVPYSVSAFIEVNNRYKAIDSVTIENGNGEQTFYFVDNAVETSAHYSYKILLKESEDNL